MSGYRIIDHTADIGIEVEGEDLKRLFENAALAMTDVTFDFKKSPIPTISVPISLEAQAVDELLVKWLSEFLYTYDTRRLVLTRFFIDKIDENHIEALAKGFKFDSAYCRQKLSIKAVTYHRLNVSKAPDTGIWTARVIFDI